jgi:hypothetical protein
MASIAKLMPVIDEPLNGQFKGLRKMLSKDVDQALHGCLTWPQEYAPRPASRRQDCSGF